MTTWINECSSLDVIGGRQTMQIGISPRACRVAGSLRPIQRQVIDAGSDPLRLRALGAIDCGIAATLTPGEPVVGVRRNGRGLALIPIGVNARVGTNVLDGEGNVIGRRWNGAWTGADMEWFFGGHFLRKHIYLRAGHPATCDFKIRRAGDWDGNLPRATARGFDVDDDAGRPLFFAQKPYLFKPGDETAASVPVDLLLRNVAGEWYLRLALPAPIAPATDWSGWVLEPTWSSQPGAADGLDTLVVNGGSADQNFGVNTLLSNGLAGTLLRRGLVQFNLSALSGTVTAATLSLYNTDNVGTTASGTLQVHRILAGNAGWVEGTVNAAIEVGSSCWNKKVYNTTNWAGSAGLGTSNTDYSATQMAQANWADGVAEALSLALNASEFSLMRANNAGFRLSATDEATAGKAAYIASSDHATAAYRPTLTVTYTAGGAVMGRGRTSVLSRGGW